MHSLVSFFCLFGFFFPRWMLQQICGFSLSFFPLTRLQVS